MWSRGVVARWTIVGCVSCGGRAAADGDANIPLQAPGSAGAVAEITVPVPAVSATSADVAAPPATTTPSGSAASSATATAPVGGTTLPLPKEPWYADKPDKRDECVAALPSIPAEHLPAPFEACDPRHESWASPPGSPHLHFHYRFFSAALTREERKHAPGICCYMVWAFPG